MASPPNPNNSPAAVAVDHHRLQFTPVNLPLTSPAKLLRLSKIVAALVSDPSKIHYFWRIRHATINILEESEQHRSQGNNLQQLYQMADAIPEGIVDVTSLTESSTGEKRKREGRLRSRVWQHFTKLIKEDGTCDKCKCNHCHKIFTSSTRSGTTHLLRHISEGICPAFKRVKTENTPTVFGYVGGSTDRKVSVSPWKYDQELGQASFEQSLDAHDDLLPMGLDDIERPTCTVSEGDYSGGQISIPVFSKPPQQPAVKSSHPIAEPWMTELRACVGKLVELTNARVPKSSSIVNKTHVAVSTPDLSIASVVKCLNEMEDIPQSSSMYLDALDIVRDPEERECFVCLNPEPRRRWLQRMLHRRFPLRYTTNV